MKLILKYEWGTEAESGTVIFPFQYENKYKFCFDFLEKVDNWRKFNKNKEKEEGKHWHCWSSFDMLGYNFTRNEIENLEHEIENCVFTLEEWFEQDEEKEIFKIK